MDPKLSKENAREHFRNPEGLPLRGFRSLLRWKLSTQPEPWPDFVSDVEPSVPPPTVDGGALRATFVNHSTVLIQQQGCNILTDPIWSERVGPLPWIGPRRRREPGISWENLPPIDAVLVSHNHYDHLDLPTLRRLASRKEMTLVVPSGVSRQLRSENFRSVRDLQWGESLSLPNFTVHCVPALHFSGRGIRDRNKTLWCGYVIESQQRLVYFAGDTGFGRHFAQIRERFGSPHLALLPIGAYQPRWFMAPVHMSPGEAVKAHEILAARMSIAIHHGTFRLSDEGIDTPKRDLIARAKDDLFLVLRNGQFLDIP